MSFISFIKELGGEVIATVLPDRTKRLLLITSLCPKLIGKEELTHEYLALLNTQLSLCREEKALEFPIAVSNYIWPQIDVIVNETIGNNEISIEDIVKRILAKIPQWLKYDREQVITAEIESFIKFNSIFYKSHHLIH